MKNEKDLGTALTQDIIDTAIGIVAVASVGAILVGVGMIGQKTLNVVKDQIDKRKKVEVEEVEED